ncbi:hypothetical protein HDU79_006630 [Rhizoclosmatium sp. JEL0117]|nr:hypothetical protein HDU79_006630 [Rhizoclosmatium sp. JEL0117]
MIKTTVLLSIAVALAQAQATPCWTPWSPGTFRAGDKVSVDGVNFQAGSWTKGNPIESVDSTWIKMGSCVSIDGASTMTVSSGCLNALSLIIERQEACEVDELTKTACLCEIPVANLYSACSNDDAAVWLDKFDEVTKFRTSHCRTSTTVSLTRVIDKRAVNPSQSPVPEGKLNGHGCFLLNKGNPCGPEFDGYPIRGNDDSLDQYHAVFRFNNEYSQFQQHRFKNITDFENQLNNFVDDTLYYKKWTDTVSPGVNRQYQATLFCMASIYKAWQAGCHWEEYYTGNNKTVMVHYPPDVIAPCAKTCNIAVDTLAKRNQELLQTRDEYNKRFNATTYFDQFKNPFADHEDYARTSSDDTAKITRTAAAHTRFVVIFLTEKYLGSAACFIEFTEAINSHNAKNRVIVFVPPKSGNTDKFQGPGIDRVKNYVGIASGIPYEAIAPSPKQAKALQRYNFNIFGAVPRKTVKISNIWLHPNLRSTGTRAASLPLVSGYVGILSLFVTIVMLAAMLLDLGQALDSAYLLSFNFDVEQDLRNFRVSVRSWANLAFEALVLVMMLFISSLSGGFDNRYRMSDSLRPLMASFNIRQQKVEDTWFSKKSLPSKFNQLMATRDAARRLPKIKVTITDFGTKNVVVETLNTFLENLDLTSSEGPMDFKSTNIGYSANREEVYVPVFIFTGKTESAIKEQVTEFGVIIEKWDLTIQECVLIAANPVNVDALFGCSLHYRNETVVMSQFLILIEDFYTGDFASEVVFHTNYNRA